MMFDALDDTRSPSRPPALRHASETTARPSEAMRSRSAQTPALVHDRLNGFYGRYGKRGLDIIGALVLILVFLPLILVIVLMQVIQPGGVLFQHLRVGRGGEEFGCLKFRTMVPDADLRLTELLERDAEARREWHETRKLLSDPRITGIGNVLRKSSLDELPQLVNVLRGEMSLVGPRPITEAELAMYGEARAAYLALRPCLTGKWQVSGRNDISYDERIQIDRTYAESFGFWGDMGILVQTVGVVLGATGR
ncbi:sugar transferase [uncultured Paracoccus sp.]|uniref:sugar transferase n=1 Tax=uncultured Paracoccus sp. TaxID=189685 RepID=UPI00263A283A|nr:sugar transferase [uncultured Paracoccus sp.]